MHLLDTDICIYLMKKRFPHLQKRVRQEDPFTIAVSAITVAEIEYGIAKSLHPTHNKNTLLAFLSPFEILPFTDIDCEAYGALRSYLEKRGEPIGPYDIQIAAQCLSRSLCLVTNNIKEFERVPQLVMENWLTES